MLLHHGGTDTRAHAMHPPHTSGDPPAVASRGAILKMSMSVVMCGLVGLLSVPKLAAGVSVTTLEAQASAHRDDHGTAVRAPRVVVHAVQSNHEPRALNTARTTHISPPQPSAQQSQHTALRKVRRAAKETPATNTVRPTDGASEQPPHQPDGAVVANDTQPTLVMVEGPATDQGPAQLFAGWRIGVAALGVGVGSVVEGVLGFGCSMVWLAVLNHFAPVPTTVAVLKPITIFMNLGVLWNCWRAATPRDVLPIALTAPVGVLLGFVAVTTLPPAAITGLLGVFILLYVYNNIKQNAKAARSAKPSTPTKSLTPIPMVTTPAVDAVVATVTTTTLPSLPAEPPGYVVTAVVGLTAGCLTSAFSTGGPPLLIYARESGWESEPSRFRANLQLAFMSMNVLTISLYIHGGRITQESLGVTLMLIPAAYVGLVVGNAVSTRVNKQQFSFLVLAGLGIIGTMYALRGLQYALS
eukprot:m.209961 g.209961  ORF g.209961 m.209961 type:complete len:469 (+) comp24790_c0_seq1:297-1703(+)